MESCGHHQTQLLDYLYDLLEPDARRTLDEHLAGCAACQAALALARRQQGLLARAARMEFPDFRFTAPGANETAAPAVIALSRSRPWLRWAAAAAVLLLVAGISAPAGLEW